MALITEKLRAVMSVDPEAVEIDFEGRDFTWGEIARAVRAMEAELDGMALPVDARVGVMLRNQPGHVAAIVAVLATDRCLVTLNPLLPDARLAEDIRRLNLPAVIGTEQDVERVAEAIVGCGSGMIIIDPALGPVRAAGRPRPDLFQSRAPGVAIEMLTSGTTGAPKRVPLSRKAFDASFAGYARYERGRDYDEKPRLRSGVTLVVNPLTHIGGIYGCIAQLAAGRKIALLERFRVESWVAAIERNKPKVAPAVPSALKMILEANVPRERLASLTALISGTAPLDPSVVDQFLERYDLPILANYGATEFAGAVAGWTIDDFRAHWAAKRGSVGRIHADMEARVVDPETGKPVPSGEEGLLELKGDQLANGGEWLRTTDRAVLDEDRFLFIRGRADNAIVRGGFKVHPDDIAKALHEHPAVREAAVVGLPDERLGAVPVAAVIARGGTQPSAEELSAFLRERLLPYQVPTRFLFVEDLPRTPSMKPSTPGLLALFGAAA